MLAFKLIESQTSLFCLPYWDAFECKKVYESHPEVFWESYFCGV